MQSMPPLIYNRCFDILFFRDIDSSVLSLTVKNLDSTSLKENISLTFQRKNVCCLFYVYKRVKVCVNDILTIRKVCLFNRSLRRV